MNRTAAVQRINQGIGFRASGNALESTIVSMLQEAQRDLERGKTLPRFLLQENQTLALVSGAHTAALPTGFLRESDDNALHFFPSTTTRPVFLARRYFKDSLLAPSETLEDSPLPSQSVPPSVFVIRKTTIDFVTNANQNYTLYWDYYKAAALLTTDIENEWLVETPGPSMGAPEWLIGEAGYRIAKDLRDADAMSIFDGLRTQGRAACFGEDIASELASGPLQMGANQ